VSERLTEEERRMRRDLHRRTGHGYCAMCCNGWPCDVIRLLDERDALASEHEQQDRDAEV